MATTAGITPSGSDSPVVEIPKLCKAGVMVKEGKDFRVEVQLVPVPEPGPNEVLIRLNCTGICLSDLHFMMGDFGYKLSSFGVRSPGHEGAGVIVKIGSLVKDWKVGDRAGIKPMWYTCSYQQYVTSPAHYTQPIPAGVEDHIAGPLMCSGGTIYRSLKESRLRHGNWAVFLGGGGGVGLQGVQIAAALGMRPVVVDTGEEKRALSMKLGAEAFVDFKKVKDVPVEVIAITDGVGAHGVFVTAPLAYSYAVACTGTRVNACVMAVGLAPFDDPSVVGASPRQLIYQNLRISGTLAASRKDISEVLDLAKRGKLKSIVAEVLPIEQLPEALERLHHGQVAGRLVIDYNL